MDHTADTDTLLAIVHSLLEPHRVPTETILTALVDVNANPELAARRILDRLNRLPSHHHRPTASSPNTSNAHTNRTSTARRPPRTVSGGSSQIKDWLIGKGSNPSTTRAPSSPPADNPHRQKRPKLIPTPRRLCRPDISTSTSTSSISSSSNTKDEAAFPPSTSRCSTTTSITCHPTSKPTVIDLTLPELTLASLQQAPNASSQTPSKPPARLSHLTLLTPASVHKHLPFIVSIPPSPIPPSLASALYLNLMRESEQWKPITWFIGGKESVSSHTVR